MGCLEGLSHIHWAYCSPFAATGHPLENRAAFDGFKQCLMTHTHLIRSTGEQKCGTRGQTGWMIRGKNGKDP